jgi:sugar O-acyltransferase (sialic acid O-acetyltransferase NeuD family)
MPEFILIGSGGHAASLLELISSLNNQVVKVYDPFSTSSSFHGVPVIKSLSHFKANKDISLALGIGNNYKRYKVFTSELAPMFSIEQFPALIHPSAVLARSARCGFGSVILQGAVVSAFCNVGDFCLINTLSSLDHESKMESYSSIAPGAHIGGRSYIGIRSAICIGATVAHSCNIGDDTVIGAQSNQLTGADSLSVYFGNPSKKIRSRMPQSNYL